MRFISIILMLLLVAACNLNANQPIPTLTPVVIVPTTRPQATDTPHPTNTPLPTVTTGSTVCVPRSDWTIFYTVVAGDTLGSIAARTNSTISQLAAGNCLTNPNNIVVGQQLRVPRVPTAPLPATATATPTLTVTPTVFVPPQPYPEPIGHMVFSSSISGDAGHIYLLRGDTITVDWQEAPANLYRATFFIVPPGQTSTTIIGEDTNPADGATISWTVPAGLNGHRVYATGRIINSTVVIPSYPFSVASAKSTAQACFMSAANPEGVTVYMQPGPDAPVFGTLWPDMTVEILGQALNGWWAFDPGVGGSSGVDRLRWVPLGAPLAFSGHCEGLSRQY